MIDNLSYGKYSICIGPSANIQFLIIAVCIMHICMHEIPENSFDFTPMCIDVCIGDDHTKEAGGHVYSGC